MELGVVYSYEYVGWRARLRSVEDLFPEWEGGISSSSTVRLLTNQTTNGCQQLELIDCSRIKTTNGCATDRGAEPTRQWVGAGFVSLCFGG